MEPQLTAEVAAAIGGTAIGRLPETVAGVSTDTRALAAGELFVALRGESFDGHAFLERAAEAGAAAAVVDRDVDAPPLPLIRVADTGVALLDLARWVRGRLRAKVVAITGTNGKTTTKDLVAKALAARHRVVSSPKSFNNFVGVPLTLFLADRETDVVVLEIGTNHPGEIATLGDVARPDVAAVTNVSEAHLEGLGSLEGVLEEKASLLDHVAEGGVTVLCRDEPSYDFLRERARGRVVSTGVKRRADYVATMPHCDFERIGFHVNGQDRVRVPMIGCHNLYNALMAIAVAAELDVAVADASHALRDFEGPPMRLTRRRSGDRLVVDDAYNANPGSTKAAIKTFASIAAPGRKVLVLGDMLELGSGAARRDRKST
ncbi:MAG: UDP-N-acetylmuramoyl-tripeptide--D-alanyl-D-alanine ligase, partial [Planctomycetota bacterium JB042]